MRMGLLGWFAVCGLLAGCDGGERTTKTTTRAESVQESQAEAEDLAVAPAGEPAREMSQPSAEGRAHETPTHQGEEPAGEMAVPQQEGKAGEVPAAPKAIPNMFRGTISRDDDRYPEQLETIDGIVVKLEDTNHKPLEAEVSVRVGRYKLKRHHIRVGEPVYGRGASGRSYRIIIERILPKGETVQFMIEAVSPGAAGEWQMP